jgi:hypothetical protein
MIACISALELSVLRSSLWLRCCILEAADHAYADAGIGPRDIDVAEMHDAIASGELLKTCGSLCVKKAVPPPSAEIFQSAAGYPPTCRAGRNHVDTLWVRPGLHKPMNWQSNSGDGRARVRCTALQS